MSTNYPSGTDVLTNPSGTQFLDNPSHSDQHTNANDAIEAIQSASGTHSGTNVLKDFVAGNFPIRRNASGVIQETFSGGTYNSQTLGTPAITGGTANNTVFGTPALTGGTYNNGVIGTPAITGGTTISQTINTPASLNATPSNGSAFFAADISAGGSFAVTTNGTVFPFGSSNNFSGLIMVNDVTDGGTGLYLVGGATIVLVSQSTAIFSATAANASTVNIFQASSIVTVENKVASTQSLRIMAFRTRTQL